MFQNQGDIQSIDAHKNSLAMVCGKTIHLYSKGLQEHKMDLKGHYSKIGSVIFVPNNAEHLASACSNGSIVFVYGG